MQRFFTWTEFDNSVEDIAGKCKCKNLSGIYGIPRGGLCLAVALSHKLNLKILDNPLKDSLIVDDVYETGLTLESYKHIEGACFFVLFSKKEPIWWNTVYLSQKMEWIIFPWENRQKYHEDESAYYKKRGLK
tara:strand:- start:225 stop:620 length:396 start_codon:yes stop_codon:yes gene_type:complete